MPSHLHELIVVLFRRDPDLATLLLREALGVAIPANLEATIAEANFSELAPTEARTDLLITFSGGGRITLVLIIEVQLRRDDKKRLRWAYYLASAAQRWHCRILLLVVPGDEATARWAAKPIAVGGEQMTLTPLVLGPSLVPRVRSPTAARARPYLALLSALAHWREPDGVEIVEAAIGAADAVDESVRLAYFEIVTSALDEATRRALEARMSLENWEIQSPFLKNLMAKGEARGEARGRAEGEARGRAAAILAVLRARAIAVSDADARRVQGCADLELLERWLTRAATATSTTAVFAAE